jgi:hypothetical protein
LRSLLHLHVPASHPVACREPTRPRQGRGGRFKLPLATKRSLRIATSTTEKMRLTDVCNRLTTRALCEPFDSRLRLHKPCDLLRAPTRGRSHELHLGGASLDGDPPASALDVHAYRDAMLGCYPLHGANEIPLGPGGCRDRRPLRRYPPATVFSTASRGDDVASDAPVAPGGFRPGFRPADLRRTPDPLPRPPRSKATASTDQSAFHRRVLPPPACADLTGNPPPAHDFAVAFRLPTPIRPFTRKRLDQPPSGDRPGAARRLLQSTRSTSTTDRIA